MAASILQIAPTAGITGTKDGDAYIPSNSNKNNQSSGSSDNIQANSSGESTESKYADIRRPLRGLSLKQNTYAYIQILNRQGDTIKVFNKFTSTLDSANEQDQGPDAVGDDVWSNWILQSVQEQRAEKAQIVDTFGESFVYFFGERPRTIQFSGILVNTADFNWRGDFWDNWEKYFRGTKLAERDFKMLIAWDDIIIQGYPLNASAGESGNDPHSMRFTFNFYVTDYLSTHKTSNNTLSAVVRRGDYLRTVGSFLEENNIKVNGQKIATSLFGDKLSLKQYVEKVFSQNSALAQSFLTEASLSTTTIAFDDLSYITSAKAAIDVANKYILRNAWDSIDRGYKSVLEHLAKTEVIPGVDTPEKVNFWFGRLSIIGEWLNNVTGAGVPTELLGRPDKVAKVMAYASLSVPNTAANEGLVDGYKPDTANSASIVTTLEAAQSSSAEDKLVEVSKALTAQSAAKTEAQPGGLVSLVDTGSPIDAYKAASAKFT